MENTIELIQIILIGLCLYLLSMHLEYKKHFFMLQAKLDMLLKQQGLVFDWLEQLPPEARQQLLQLKEKDGIQLIRQHTGLGLMDAKVLLDDYKQKHAANS
ncbi:hypothetical protein [Rheinheimera soli]|uniref:Ribosomal protein L7/L12 C-terminal domain-containing protein n=1 Tax=Rheinheimera soli TaxID=443616 RepID=A0ABU1VVY0_9GAMM|nr:hypothetical protein [Rheinheimera soli]MDR7119885.1 hypothetical protein [Rheinheimera soli]